MYENPLITTTFKYSIRQNKYMQISTPQRDSSNIHRVSARNKFKGFTPEKEQVVRKLNVEKNEVLQELKKAWDSYHYECSDFFFTKS